MLDKGKTREVLLGIMLLGGGFMVPGASRFMYSRIAKRLAGTDSPAEQAIKARRLKELASRRLISVKPVGAHKVEVTLTGEGKKLVKLYQFDDLKLPKLSKWDKKWRVITYDIPVRQRKASLALSAKFHKLGMFRIQKSIWVYPYDCKDDIDAICAIFDINPDNHVLYLVSDKIPREADARKHFDLALA